MVKYYTPDIEEFHVGFEYEMLLRQDNGKSEWTSQVFDGEETRTYFIEELNRKDKRVKYLNKEDIEGLGLIHIKDGLDEEVSQKYMGNFGNGFCFYLTVTPLSFTSIVSIHTSVYKNSTRTKIVDSIRIKNKSELKRILKQLNIKINYKL